MPKMEVRLTVLLRDKNGKIKMDYDPNRSEELKNSYKELMTTEEWEEHFG